MGLIDTIANTLKKAGTWAAKNSAKAMDTVQKVESLCFGKAYAPNDQADRVLVAEQRVNQLQEKTEKLDKKLDQKTAALDTRVQAMEKQLRTLKIWLTVISVTLALAIAAVAIFAFWL